MSKAFYIYTSLLLGISFWDLLPLTAFFNPNTIPVMILVWAMFGMYHYRKLPEAYDQLDFSAYKKYYWWIYAGILLSIVPAYVFWNHDFVSSLIVNRSLIIYIFIPVFFLIKPTDKEIMRAIIFFTITYMLVWLVQALLMPLPITVPFLVKVTSGAPFEIDPTDFGMLLPGYPLIVLLLYLKLQQFRESSTFKTLLPALLVFFVIFLLQNRGTLFFASAVLMYVLVMMKSNYKPYHLLLYVLVGVGLLYSTFDSWIALIEETRQQAGDMDYNRWKALSYFMFEFSPNWLCYIFGNGRFSFHTDAGANTIALALDGYDQTDIGIIGFWSVYGLLPIVVIYRIVAAVITRRDFPFYMKAISFHLLIIPIAWNFISTDAMMLVLYVYLFAYYSESNKVLNQPDVVGNEVSNPEIHPQ